MMAQDLRVIMGTVLAAAIRMMDASFGRCPEDDCHFQCSDRKVTLKWSYLFGQFCGLAKMHLVSVHAAFRVSAWPKYAMSGVRLSRAV